MHELTTPLSKNWLVLALAGIAITGSHPAFAQAAANTQNETTVRSRIAFDHVLPQLDARRLQVKLVEVTYAPGGFSLPHSHPFPVIVYVIDGALRVQVKGEPEVIYKAGESFYEAPNGVHLVSANASNQQPARFIACFVCDRDKPLSVPVPTQGDGSK
jgi:quercetin dioxygenase-like cupin family protein